jgi:cytochrome c-type biogenesis protein CcmH
MQQPDGGAADPRLAELQKVVDANPTDLGALNRLTAAAIAAEDMATALKSNQRAMELNPEDADARTYNAVLKAFIGRKDEALLQLEEIGRAFPNRSAAFVYRGLLLLESDPATALVAFEAAAKVDPNPEIQQMIEVARRRAAAGPGGVPGAQSVPPPGASPGSAPGAPASAAGGSADGAAAGGEVLASGTIKLADPARAAGKSALFVFLRAPGGGPPFAAVKLPPGPFPMDFSITRANLIPMMAGRPLPPTLELQARLDADGNATTRDDPETTATLSPFQPGTTGAALDLK